MSNDTLIGRFKTAIKELKPTYAGGYILKEQAIQTLESIMVDASTRKDEGNNGLEDIRRTSSTNDTLIEKSFYKRYCEPQYSWTEAELAQAKEIWHFDNFKDGWQAAQTSEIPVISDDILRDFSALWETVERAQTAIRHDKVDYVNTKNLLVTAHGMCRPLWEKLNPTLKEPSPMREISKPSDSRWEQAGEIFRELSKNASIDIYALHEKYMHSPGMLAWFITTFSQMVDEKEGILSLKPKSNSIEDEASK